MDGAATGVPGLVPAVADDDSRPREGGPDPDPRYIVVDGRRWRVTDPSIPPGLRSQLVGELMAARRDVGAAVRSGDAGAEHQARRRVQNAKLALGERGEPWWEEPTVEGRRRRIAATMLSLLRARLPASSVCPSDVARAVGGRHWRTLLPMVRDVAGALVASEVVRVTQGAVPVEVTTARGPVRIRRGAEFA